MPPAILLTDLRKTYRTGPLWRRRRVEAMNGLNLEVPAGEIFGLLGPNGAGKTTAVKTLAGLVLPDHGSLEFPAFSRRPSIGAVMEGSRNLYWRLSCMENIEYFGELKGVSLKHLRQQGPELLELFGLAAKRDSPAQTLSRGMQQKLAVVLALLGEPQLLLLDEPTLGLDVESSQTIQRLLRRLCDERGLTILVTTHQMDLAENLCQRVAILRAGQVVLSDSVDALVDLFKRQDYVLRFDAQHWPLLQPRLAGYAVEILPEPRPGQIAVRIPLPEARDIYPLMQIFGDLQVELHDFRQELPTLESIFISVTGLEPAAGRPGGAQA